MKKNALRFFNMLLGLFLYGFGIALTINAGIGYGPWEVFHAGLGYQLGLTIGVASIVVGIIIVIVLTLLKEKLGFGTIASMTLTGLFIDLVLAVNVVPVPTNIVLSIVMLVAGLFIIATGSYFYIKSALGVGPRDNLMVVLSRKTKLPIGICRGIVELTATLLGWLLGGMVGIGTLISGFTIGFCIQTTFMMLKFDATAIQHESINQTLSSVAKK